MKELNEDMTLHEEPTATTHPLDRLTADEITSNHDILTRSGLITPDTRFALVSLAEPTKSEVLSYDVGGESLDRRVASVLYDRIQGRTIETVVSLTSGELLEQREVDVAREGQAPILDEEVRAVELLVRADHRWQEAMRARQIEDVNTVRICPLSAGTFDLDGEQGRRLLRCLAFQQFDENDNAWAHPVDGVVAYVDMGSREVIAVHDHVQSPIPQRSENYHQIDPADQRTTQKPIVITQPDGASFSVEGNVIEWERWSLRVGFDPVEGLVLHQVGFQDGDLRRPILYRASVAEMVVPYGDPSPVRFWQNYFDAGEYSLGKRASSLRLGCDCLGEITYLDAVVARDNGLPTVVENAICLHEEDYGILWKHTDGYNGSRETRRQRRMVISFFLTIGNYDYGFYWYLYLDGTIELECKATGIVFTAAYSGIENGTEWASEVAPGVGAPFHQHLFSARLDMMVDGLTNAVVEEDAVRVPMGEQNPYGNGFTRRHTTLQTERDGVRDADRSRGRVWRIVNTERNNRLGQPVAYALHPEGGPTLLADPGSSIARRAAFATKHLWVTRYRPEERFPAGNYVNQSVGTPGLPDWIRRDDPIDGEDIVLWHTFGLTHYPRSEDWPIMPVDYTGFVLKPSGFFDRNPTLDVPPSSTGGSCHSG